MACPEIKVSLERSQGTWAASFLFLPGFIKELGLSPVPRAVVYLHVPELSGGGSTTVYT